MVTSYNTPVSRRESFLFFSRPGPSRLQKLSIEDSYLLGESDFHSFLRGPDDVSVKRGYTLLDRRVLCYMCLFLCMWFFTRKGDWILKFSKLPPLSGYNPLSGGTFPMFSYPSVCLKPCRWKLEDLVNLSDRASLLAYMVKSLPAMQETRVPSLGQEGLLEKEMATCSRTRPWCLEINLLD